MSFALETFDSEVDTETLCIEKNLVIDLDPMIDSKNLSKKRKADDSLIGLEHNKRQRKPSAKAREQDNNNI
jgi:hypothetical protein